MNAACTSVFGTTHFSPSIRPAPRTSSNTAGKSAHQRRQRRRRSTSPLRDRPRRGSRGPASRPAPRWRRRRPAGCRRTWCRGVPGVEVFRHALAWPGWRPSGSRRRCPWPRDITSGSMPAHSWRTACRCGPCRTAPRPGRATGRTRRRRRAGRAGSRCGAGRMPPSPCTGSTMMPAVCGPMASRTAFRLLNGTWSKPSTARAEAVAGISRCRWPPAWPACGRGRRRRSR